MTEWQRVSRAGAAEPAHRQAVVTPRPSPADDDSVLDAVEQGEVPALPSLAGVLKGLSITLAQLGPLGGEARHLVQDLLRIARGADDAPVPSPRDKRFADPAWAENPVYRRLGQSYIALGQALGRLVGALEGQDRDWHEIERARFAVNALISTMAPTNTLLGNPTALKRAFDTGGVSVARGLQQALHDIVRNGGMPSQTDREALRVGTHLALTDGAVVSRDAVAELLQYRPTTSTVSTRPVLIIPPPIGRYYFLDLRPGRSFVEHAVDAGLQVFLLSWRNPQQEQSQWGVDTYAQRIVEAIEQVQEITGSDDVNTVGFCAGGILMTTVLSHLSQLGRSDVHSATYAVTLLDFDSRAPLGAFSAPRLLELARRDSRRKGIVPASSLAAVFSWMRPDDLVFNYVVNNWLLGEKPPVFDILAWNADGTNLPARLHDEFLSIFRGNPLVTPGGLDVLGTPVDVTRIPVPTFVTGAVNDHLTPWTGCYRTTELLPGPSTFVLSNAGHIASLVNPPGNPKASYWIGGAPDADADGWLASATQASGSWWEPWVNWARERSGPEKAAPSGLGSDRFPPVEPAPGSYVVDRTAAPSPRLDRTA